METIKKEKKAEGKLVKGGYASFNEYGELVEEGKMEKKADLEQLLKKLLELGWKPNGKEYNHIHAEANRIMSDFGTFYRFCNYVEDGSINRCLNLKLREIVSINSGIWQFVCEKDLINEEHQFFADYEYNEWSYKKKTSNPNRDFYLANEYEYRLIESSLKDESELEEFLLSNIKVEG